MRQGGFAASRRARDDVKREFRETSAQNLIETRNPGREFFYRHFTLLGHIRFLQEDLASKFLKSGHTSSSMRSIRLSPMNATSSPSSWAMSTTPASASSLRRLLRPS